VRARSHESIHPVVSIRRMVTVRSEAGHTRVQCLALWTAHHQWRKRITLMSAIRATCAWCGDVDLTSDDVELRIGPAPLGNTYCFSCPDCGSFVEKPADGRIVRLLLAGGVAPAFVRGPTEMLEAHDGPKITHDDLLTFHEMLEASDCLAELVGDLAS
jgi:hypothetical protein